MMNTQWTPPSLQSEAASERHATWTELFYDLAIVAAIAVMGHEFASRPSVAGLRDFALVFVPLWWAWAGSTFYADRFDTDDTLHRWLFFVQMAGICGMAVFTHGVFEEGFAGFAVSYALVRLVLIVSYVRVGILHPRTRGLAVRYAVGFTVALLPWLVGVFAPEAARRWLVLAALLIDYATPHTAHRQQASLPLNVSHLPERFGLFSIIVLGETVAAIVRTGTAMPVTSHTVVAGVLTLVIAISIWWLYFSNLDASNLRKIKWTGQVWVYTHLPFVFGLVLLSVGTEKLTEEIAHHGHGNSAGLAGYSFALCISALSVIELLGERSNARPNAAGIRLATRLIAVVCALLAGSVFTGLGAGLNGLGLYAALGLAMVTGESVLDRR